MQNNEVQENGILGTAPVHDFSGTLFPAPTITNFEVLARNIRELGENTKLNDTDEFAARANEFASQFKQETNAGLDFIEADRDFSTIQQTGNQANFQRLRSRQEESINSAFATSAGLVQSRENKRLIEEERELEKERLKEATRLELQMMAANKGIQNPSDMKKNDLINAIAKRTSEDIAYARRPKGKAASVVVPTINTDDAAIRAAAIEAARAEWIKNGGGTGDTGTTTTTTPNQTTTVPNSSPASDGTINYHLNYNIK